MGRMNPAALIGRQQDQYLFSMVLSSHNALQQGSITGLHHRQVKGFVKHPADILPHAQAVLHRHSGHLGRRILPR